MALSDYFSGISIEPGTYTDSVTGSAVDFNNQANIAYAVIQAVLRDDAPTYTLTVQVSSDGVAWGDSDLDPVAIGTGVDEKFVEIGQFSRDVRYARASLNVVDGPGDIDLCVTLMSAPVATDADVAPIALSYDPEAQYVAESSAIIIPRGSGLPIIFSPSTPAEIVAESNWEARLGVPGQTPVIFSVAEGNMTVDTETGDITINPEIADTSALSIRNVVYLELWRKGSGDDNNSLLFRCPVTVVRTLIA